ncbi:MULTISPECIES: DUF488 domain-containing protein [Sphingomonas]|uniref:DUF488 domain-containing protein n=1 Tax=Sphingomonas TaxID=13687 RepID=UPI000A5F9B39|nr:DUF488 domain-containing protein [Sphingomonas sp. CCH10-B3]
MLATAIVPELRIKRVYLPADPADGTRVLVDRLWPRGLTREAAAVDHWLKEVAPSNELRRWFHHQVAHWVEFVERYHAELAEPTGRAALDALIALVRAGPVTLLYGAKDESHNQAQVLRTMIAAEVGLDG